MISADFSLADSAEYPLITPEKRAFPVQKLFIDAGLAPEYVVAANTPDVVKRNAAAGLGVAIVPTETFEPDRDALLQARDASHLFPAAQIVLGCHKSAFARHYMYDFVRLIVPQATDQDIAQLLKSTPEICASETARGLT